MNHTTKGVPNGFRNTYMITISVKDPVDSAQLAIDITGATTNRAAAQCSLPKTCKQAPSVRGALPVCACLQDVAIMPGGRAWVLPQPLPRSPGPIGQIIRFAFIATHPTSRAACYGSADLCFVAGGGGRKPLACAVWNSTHVARGATTC